MRNKEISLILYLCTGNYYRSRLAEGLFNENARKFQLSWRAESRGLAKNLHRLTNPGPISRNTLRELEKRGIHGKGIQRFPKPIDLQELHKFRMVIALDKHEHKPMIERDYPQLLDIVQYWNIPDADREIPEKAAEKIEHEINKLIHHLKNMELGCRGCREKTNAIVME